MQEKGEIDEVQLRALEEDITGRVSVILDGLTAVTSAHLHNLFRSCLHRGVARDLRSSTSCARFALCRIPPQKRY